MSVTQAPPQERIRIAAPQIGREVEDQVLPELPSGHLAQAPNGRC